MINHIEYSIEPKILIGNSNKKIIFKAIKLMAKGFLIAMVQALG